MDVRIDVFYQGKVLMPESIAAPSGLPKGDYTLEQDDDFVLFLDEKWRGRHVMVQEIPGDRVLVQVGDDLRAPIPWRSVEAALTAGGR